MTGAEHFSRLAPLHNRIVGTQPATETVLYVKDIFEAIIQQGLLGLPGASTNDTVDHHTIRAVQFIEMRRKLFDRNIDGTGDMPFSIFLVVSHVHDQIGLGRSPPGIEIFHGDSGRLDFS